MAKRWWWVAALLAVVALIGYANRVQPVAVVVASVDSGVVESTVANTRAGTVKACQRSRLSMPIGGVVDRLLVSEGDRVQKGQLLLELWNRDRAAEVAQAKASLNASRQQSKQACLQAELNQREATRLKSMLQRKLASEEQVDRAVTTAATQQQACAATRAQIDVAAAQLSLREAVLERTQLHAPFAGVVAEVNGDLGEYVTPSPPGVPTPPAVDLIDDSCLYVTAPIDEVDARHLAVGQPVRITLDAFRDEQFAGHITRIAPYVLDLEKQARTVDVDVRIDERPEGANLLVGYSADITVILDARNSVLRIPSEAVLEDDSVWVVRDGRAESQLIEVGLHNWSYTEVVKGLAAGEQVIRNPDAEGLEAGVAVEISDD